MNLLKYSCALLILGVLAACGGGGGNPGTSSGALAPAPAASAPVVATAPTIGLTMKNSANATVTTVTASEVFTLQATVKDANGVALAGKVVTFGSNAALVKFSPATGTSLTDANGVAAIQISPALATSGGALTIAAEATVVGTTVLLATLGVTVVPADTGNGSAIVEVLTSANTLLSSGSEAVITAFVKNSANVGLAGQTVAFSATSGTLQVASFVSDATGAVSAKLIAGNDKSVRDITVAVTAGSAVGSVVVSVTGTRVTLAGSGGLQAGGAASQYTVRALDSSNNPISGAQIVVRSTLGNSITTPLKTDATGTTTFLYTPNKAGSDTLTVNGLGTSVSSTVVVNAIDFIVLSPAGTTSVAIGALQTVVVQYKLLGVGVPGQTVAFSTTRGTLVASTAITDLNGQATATVSSTTAGPAVVVAQISGVGSVNLPVQFVATTPATIVVQANPGGILPNTSGKTNQSTIEAVVRDANGNAVAGRDVNFTALQDSSNGTIDPPTSTTDANGRAQVQFIPGALSTQANGVRIQAEVASTGIRSIATLTVNGKALFITLAFGNEIANVDETTYKKAFSVYVTDANGVAVGNQLITLSVIPTEYYKGTLAAPDLTVPMWRYASAPTRCANEDLNFDGVLDAGEDTNGNGQLTPGNIAVASPGTVTTDASGRASFVIQYGEQFVPWARVRITAQANVTGTESRQSILFDLVGLAKDFTDETVPPAGAISPFGTSALCTDSN